MTEQLPPVSHDIDLDLARELGDKDFRDEFFRGQLEISIPEQIKNLRKFRSLNQQELAEKAGMKQSAVSRLEGANYGKWGVDTLLRIAEALDSRLTVTFEPYEAVLAFYKTGGPRDRRSVTEVLDAPHQDEPKARVPDTTDRERGQKQPDSGGLTSLQNREKAGM